MKNPLDLEALIDPNHQEAYPTLLLCTGTTGGTVRDTIGVSPVEGRPTWFLASNLQNSKGTLHIDLLSCRLVPSSEFRSSHCTRACFAWQNNTFVSLGSTDTANSLTWFCGSDVSPHH
jgi:hypothetical protein